MFLNEYPNTMPNCNYRQIKKFCVNCFGFQARANLFKPVKLLCFLTIKTKL